MSASIGQNFLVNQNVAEKIVKKFLPVEGKILEIGPGKGILTDLLVKYRQDNKITAIELDEALYYKLRDKYTENFEVLNRDILKIDLNRLFPDTEEKIHIIGNVPYYISKDLIDWVIQHVKRIKKGIFMMQKEFVDKMFSSTDSKDYNAQSVLFNGLFYLEKQFDVQPGSFSPQPKVKSTVFSFETLAENLGENIDSQEFYQFLQRCFANRRKTLLNNLSDLDGHERLWDAFEYHNINPKIRAEQLTLPDFLEIYSHLFLV